VELVSQQEQTSRNSKYTLGFDLQQRHRDIGNIEQPRLKTIERHEKNSRNACFGRGDFELVPDAPAVLVQHIGRRTAVRRRLLMIPVTFTVFFLDC
jgi:hypothetical protein